MNAVVLQMPAKVQRAAKRRINRTELEARHSWMMGNHRKWETEVTDGANYPEPMVARLMDAMRKEWKDEFPPLTMARMRRDITGGRNLIEKRNRVKSWLVSLGVDLADVKDAEQALFAAFDKLA